MSVKPVIASCAGTRLDPEERALFRAERPAGLILFARNCDNPDQLRALVADFRDAVDDAEAFILVDQEGGRVARLQPPHWRAMPPAAVYGRMAKTDFVHAAAALQLASEIVAHELLDVGVNVNCWPVLDVPAAGADSVIGDRAFADDPEIVARLGRIAVDALCNSGVLPVIKHIPGHGRATVDSHTGRPHVDADIEALYATDFRPFEALVDAPMAMTAHVVYEALDPELPATVSPRVIGEAIRGHIGFEGLLLTDDIAMQALDGSLAERTRAALAAGCDLVLYCGGDRSEAGMVLDAAEAASDDTLARIDAARARVREPKPVDVANAETRLATLLAEWA
ncbi:MAG: beta-N-acetylhexosaminidase [Alphaproteobacteria bacterium]|nr:MAG: beta-N-acetylhexosaminidase [Alphaproteobacteria bacterium]